MLGQIVGAQAVLEAALAELAGADLTVREQLRSQISLVAGLRQQVGTSQGTALSALRAEVATVAGSAAAAAQDARTSAAADLFSTSAIATLARTAREQVNNVMAGMKDFDRDVRFSSPEEAAAYRQREADRQSYIAAEQAKHSPGGDLNASGAAVGQMADAAAHGAANSPQFQPRFDALVQSTQALREQIIRDGGDVSQFDTHLREDLRTIMRSKGVPDAQIDGLLAAHPGNPLEAVKAFVADQKGVITEKEIGELEAKASAHEAAAVADSPSTVRAVATSASAPPSEVPASAMDAMADLRALGVVPAEHDATAPPAHGVPAQVRAAPSKAVTAHT